METLVNYIKQVDDIDTLTTIGNEYIRQHNLPRISWDELVSQLYYEGGPQRHIDVMSACSTRWDELI